MNGHVPAKAPAIFFDRDGVLNTVVWRSGKAASPRSLEEFELEPEAPEALQALRAAGYRLFAVTNQPDIARGLMSPDALGAMHARLLERLPLEAVRACEHDNADGCDCRKPKPGLILGLAHEHDLDLAGSWMVGDQDRDIACGKGAGVQTILLRRSYNQGDADHVVSTLSQAARTILGERAPS